MATDKATIGTAIIGTGKVAHAHAAALSTNPRSRFEAVCNPDPELAHSFARRYGVRAFTDARELLRDPAVDAVCICTPHPSHAGLALMAAGHGVHILVEKPMALTLGDCDRMIQAAAQAGVKLGVISQRRLYEPVQRVKRAIDAGKIGRPILGTATVLSWRGPEYYALDDWRGTWAGEGGGVLVTQVIHHLDLLQWLMGPVAEVSAYWSNLNHPFVEVEDTAVASLRFASGALGSIVVSNSQNPGLYARIHVHGSSGATAGVQTDGGTQFISGVSEEAEPPYNDLWTVPGEQDLLPGWQAADRARAGRIDIMSHYHGLQIADFLEAILEDWEPMITGQEGRKMVELVQAIYCSGTLQRPVRFPVAETIDPILEGRIL